MVIGDNNTAEGAEPALMLGITVVSAETTAEADAGDTSALEAISDTAMVAKGNCPIEEEAIPAP